MGAMAGSVPASELRALADALGASFGASVRNSSLIQLARAAVATSEDGGLEGTSPSPSKYDLLHRQERALELAADDGAARTEKEGMRDRMS